MLELRIPGTRRLHSFIPVSNYRVRTKIFSSSDIFKEEAVILLDNELPLKQINGFITCIHDRQWWLACVLELSSEVKVTILHPHGPSASFKYRPAKDVISIPVSDVLTTVDPRTTTGRVYTLSQKESKTASDKLVAILSGRK